MTRIISLTAGLLIAVQLCLLSSSCKSNKNESKAPSGNFMQNEPSREGSSTKSFFAREREKRREHEREFRDVRRPMNQEHFQVLPTHGKDYTPRSERLLESGRNPDSSIYGF